MKLSAGITRSSAREPKYNGTHHATSASQSFSDKYRSSVSEFSIARQNLAGSSAWLLHVSAPAPHADAVRPRPKSVSGSPARRSHS